MKKALLLNAVNPAIGGVLIRGDKGTAKSTAVRALSEVLPEISVMKNCPFNCNPENEEEMCESCRKRDGRDDYTIRQVKIVNLPLGATEDRVVGTIDIEKAIKEGTKAVEPGILAEVNRGILYIDEVNLLDDHVADILLDSAAMGVNVVEREGISLSHPSKFILIGTMNPEEGELRPQLLDRFGLQVTVEGILNPDLRMNIVRAAELFERDPEGYCALFSEMQDKLREIIVSAKKILPVTEISDEKIRLIVDTCISLGIKTHRAEITIMRTAKTVAALDGRKTVSDEDIREAMKLALPHRMRRKPFEEPELDEEMLDDLFNNRNDDHPDDEKAPPESRTSGSEPEKSVNSGDNRKSGTEEKSENSGNSGGADSNNGNSGNSGREPSENSCGDISGEANSSEKIHLAGEPVDSDKIKYISVRDRLKRRNSGGKRSESLSSTGHYRSSKSSSSGLDLAFDATLRAAAPYQNQRSSAGIAVSINKSDLMEKVRVGKVSAACVFVVDASGSMGAMNRMESAKGAVMSMLGDSYINRDRVGLVAFKGDKADLLLPLCSSVDLAKKSLEELPTGGRTPLSAGLFKGLETLLREKRKNSRIMPMLVCITDGRSNRSLSGNIKEELVKVSEEIRSNGIHAVFIDTENSENNFLKMQIGYCKMLAEHSGGSYYSLAELSRDSLYDIASSEIDLLN
nr:magnesium chelatase subunit D family protein [Methanoplanus limicola]